MAISATYNTQETGVSWNALAAGLRHGKIRVLCEKVTGSNITTTAESVTIGTLPANAVPLFALAYGTSTTVAVTLQVGIAGTAGLLGSVSIGTSGTTISLLNRATSSPLSRFTSSTAILATAATSSGTAGTLEVYVVVVYAVE